MQSPFHLLPLLLRRKTHIKTSVKWALDPPASHPPAANIQTTTAAFNTPQWSGAVDLVQEKSHKKKKKKSGHCQSRSLSSVSSPIKGSLVEMMLQRNRKQIKSEMKYTTLTLN